MSKKIDHQTNPDPHSFLAKKSLGQNFLTSNVVPGWLADAGQITEDDIVLEIGPGTGALTSELLRRGATVYAIETDARAIAVLHDKFQTELDHQKLTLIEADMRNFDISTLPLSPQKYKVVANIPYYLSGFLLRLFLEHTYHPHLLVFLMQKELVTRIARDQKNSLLALGVKAFGTPKYIKTVTRGHFQPAPKVDSAILQVANISHQNFKNQKHREQFFSLLHLGFGQKRKQLKGNLSKRFDKTLIVKALEQAGVGENIRAEDLNLEQWLIISNYLNQAKS